MRSWLVGLIVVVGVAAAPAAQATSRVVDITKAQATAAAGSIGPAAEVLVRGLVAAGRTVDNTIAFTPGASRVRVNTSWVVGEADARFRLIALNVDLLDSSGNVLASDDFQGLVAGTALSILEANGLIPGTRYRLKLTATSIGRGSYSMTIRATPPPAP